jgi:hypothetical protein
MYISPGFPEMFICAHTCAGKLAQTVSRSTRETFFPVLFNQAFLNGEYIYVKSW